VRLTSPIGGATDGSVNLSTSLSNVAKQAAHPKFVWVFNANCEGTIIYNDPVEMLSVAVFERLSYLCVIQKHRKQKKITRSREK
jgi:ferredoxin-NADP reductase